MKKASSSTRRSKPKPAKKAVRSAKPSVKSAKNVKHTKSAAVKKALPRRAPAARPKAARIPPLDLSGFPPEAITTLEKRLCLACVLDIFTRHLGVAARTAHLEIKRYTPPLAELYAEGMTRPWFASDDDLTSCPYCGSSAKWHTTLRVYRIESGKAIDARRRELVKSLPQSDDQFVVLEEKATQQHAFFECLEIVSAGLDLDNPTWLRDVSLHYLRRKEPKTDWEAQFAGLHAIRRSRRLESGWEVDQGRLFLNPNLFDELLLVQYLVSRSHRAGGLTLEGRYTLPELFVRLRNSGYLRAAGIAAQNAADALEELVVYLGGGEAAIKFHHIVDRRDFLDKVKSLKLVKPPKPKKQ